MWRLSSGKAQGVRLRRRIFVMFLLRKSWVLTAAAPPAPQICTQTSPPLGFSWPLGGWGHGRHSAALHRKMLLNKEKLHQDPEVVLYCKLMRQRWWIHPPRLCHTVWFTTYSEKYKEIQTFTMDVRNGSNVSSRGGFACCMCEMHIWENRTHSFLDNE